MMTEACKEKPFLNEEGQQPRINALHFKILSLAMYITLNNNKCIAFKNSLTDYVNNIEVRIRY